METVTIGSTQINLKNYTDQDTDDGEVVIVGDFLKKTK